jgi:hypothetical protein
MGHRVLNIPAIACRLCIMRHSVLRRVRVGYALLFVTTRTTRERKGTNQNKERSYDSGYRRLIDWLSHVKQTLG